MRICLALFLFTALAACTSKDSAENRSKAYFDLEGFFVREAARLYRQKATVAKTVVQNGKGETRELTIQNWTIELDLFLASDINKPAWRKSYRVLKYPQRHVYTAIDSSLKTRRIQIHFDKRGVGHRIEINNETTNPLYRSSEELLYIRDSCYLISRKQKVVLLGTDSYTIKGIFKPKLQ